MRNNNKMAENDVGKVWVQNVVSLCWFSNFGRLSCRKSWNFDL